MCSDGVTDYVPEEDIAQLVAEASSPETAAAAIVARSLEAGTRDNATAVVCDVEVPADARAPQQARFYGAAAARFCEELETA